MEKQKVCKCERCGRIRDLFQYTFFDTPKIIRQVKNNGIGSDPMFTEQVTEIDESRGLCEECAIEVNKKKYDKLF